MFKINHCKIALIAFSLAHFISSSDFLISAENKMAPFFHFGTSLGIIGECVSELQVRPWVGKLGVVEVIQQVLDCAV